MIAVGHGQVEAAYALGMQPRLAMRRVVLPQAVPVAIPPLGNEFIGMLKYSALASVIAVRELLGSAEAIYSTNLKTLELLVVASLCGTSPSRHCSRLPSGRWSVAWLGGAAPPPAGRRGPAGRWRDEGRGVPTGRPMTIMAFPGHAMNCLRSCWPLTRWRSLARTGRRVDQ